MKHSNNPESNIHQVGYVSFLERDGVLYEEVIGSEGEPPVFIEFHKLTNETVGVVDEVDGNGKKYRPLDNIITQKGIVLLPSEVGEYSSVKDLMSIIKDFIHKYLDISEMGEFLSVCYVLLSWIYDCFETIPYLRFLGDFGTGKSRALKVVGSLSYKPLFCGGSITPSPIFRLIEDFKGTLIIDEADFSFSDHHAEIIKILNCGFTRGMPVLRTEGDAKKEPRAFDVFSPKIIGARGSYKDLALESRCLTEIMRGNPRPDIPFQLPNTFEEEALRIRNMLLLFRLRTYGGLQLDERLRIPGVEARINQIAMPILAIIEDESERKRLVEYIVEYDKKVKIKRSDELPATILEAIIKLHEEGQIITHKAISSIINVTRVNNGEYKISPAKIGRINSDLGFEVRRVNGVSEFMWEEERAKMLCVRYGLEMPTQSPTSSTNPTDIQVLIDSL